MMLSRRGDLAIYLDNAIFAKLFANNMLHFSIIQSHFPTVLVLLLLIFAPMSSGHAQCIDLKAQKPFTLLKADFEAALLRHYTFDQSNIGYGYQMYLKDIAERNMPLHMWTESKSIKLAKDFYKTDFFKSHWISSTEIKDQAGGEEQIDISPPVSYTADASLDEKEVQQEEKKFLLLNPNGSYFECMLAKETNADYISIISSLRAVPDLNPELVALTFATQVPDLTESMKEYIVLVFYAELLLRVHQVI